MSGLANFELTILLVDIISKLLFFLSVNVLLKKIQTDVTELKQLLPAYFPIFFIEI